MAGWNSVNSLRPFPVSLEGVLGNFTGYWREMQPYWEERLSPCRTGCPVGEDIPASIALASSGAYEEAFFKITEENPLPSVCGRVCFHPCEDNCLRTELDEPVSIHRVERFVGDFGLKHLAFSPPKRSAKGSIAIVGSGPTGISAAYHARLLGHPVTLFERGKKLGGLLRFGIPTYRLPRRILDQSIRMILNLKMEVCLGFQLDDRSSWNDLEKYDAIFLAIGAQESIIPPIPAMKSSSVIGGLEFLKDTNSGRITSVGKKVVVIGGGNTAIDASRVCRRFGADVAILYRRSRDEMPGHVSEINAALDEGVELVERCVPVQIETSSPEGLKIVCKKTEAQSMALSGRTPYEAVEGSEFTVKADLVIWAIGQSVHVPEYVGPIRWSHEGIEVSRYLRCGDGKFFAGGDVVAGPRRICDALRLGKLGALSMHCYLEGLNIDEIWPSVGLNQEKSFSMGEFMNGFGRPNPRLQKMVDPNEVKRDSFPETKRLVSPQIPPQKAIQEFKEVTGNLTKKELHEAACRCFSCGTCIKCDQCHLYCPDVSVIKNSTGYEIDYDYCKGCGLCAEECPRGVFHMRREET